MTPVTRNPSPVTPPFPDSLFLMSAGYRWAWDHQWHMYQVEVPGRETEILFCLPEVQQQYGFRILRDFFPEPGVFERTPPPLNSG